jgi:hypothetical protein
LPGSGQIRVRYGQPIRPEEIATFDDRQLVAEVERRLVACHREAKVLRSRCLGLR